MYDILVAGEINPDLILTGDVRPEFGQVEKLVERAALTIGSSSAIFACGAARLGLQVAFTGVCGDDVFGRFMLAEMQAHAVDVSQVIVRAGEQTGLSVILNDQSDRAILTYQGLMAGLQAADIPDRLLRQSRHLHVASYFLQKGLQPGLPALFHRARALGLTTSLDTNYDPSEQWRSIDDLLSATDVFLPNCTEALAFTRCTDVEAAAQRLAGLAGVVAIKLGAQGALADKGALGDKGALDYKGDSRGALLRCPSIDVRVVDTVGAGDSFDAGFIYGYLQGWPLEKSLRLACVCGALSTQRAGGTQGQPTLEQAVDYL